jgi:hypothetical protein
MLTPYLPYPPASGGQIRSLYLLKYLSKKNEITLICLYKNEKEKKYAANLKQYCKKLYVCKRAEKPWQIKNILKSVFSFKPFLMVRNYSDEARTIVEKLLAEEKFDVIHAETFYIMPQFFYYSARFIGVISHHEKWFERKNRFQNIFYLPRLFCAFADI